MVIILYHRQLSTTDLKSEASQSASRNSYRDCGRTNRRFSMTGTVRCNTPFPVHDTCHAYMVSTSRTQPHSRVGANAIHPFPSHDGDGSSTVQTLASTAFRTPCLSVPLSRTPITNQLWTHDIRRLLFLGNT